MKGKKYSSRSNPYFDDCHICQSVKTAEAEGKSLSVEELKKVFEVAKSKQASRAEIKKVLPTPCVS